VCERPLYILRFSSLSEGKRFLRFSLAQTLKYQQIFVGFKKEKRKLSSSPMKYGYQLHYSSNICYYSSNVMCTQQKLLLLHRAQMHVTTPHKKRDVKKKAPYCIITV
jgi:hypothetical protein